MLRSILNSRRTLVLAATLAGGAIGAVGYVAAADKLHSNSPVVRLSADAMQHRTSPFKGAKANTGYAVHYTENGKSYLAVSDDFEIPNTPAPSWQIIDSRGNVYLLNQFKIKGGTNRRIVVPSYIPDIVKVQVWCSYAEVLLGEASFDQPVK